MPQKLVVEKSSNVQVFKILQSDRDCKLAYVEMFYMRIEVEFDFWVFLR